MRALIFMIILFISGCMGMQDHKGNNQTAVVTVTSTDRSLEYKNGRMFYSGVLFTGIIMDHFPDGSKHLSTSYVNGKEHGWQLTWSTTGYLLEKRSFTNGEKDGVHTGWWENGNKRFEYNFTNGIYNGDFKEWYESGKILKHIHYTNGNDDHGKGWRETGKVYMSFVIKNGRRYGLNNSNLCYTVKNEKGEYINSTTAN